MEETLLGHPRAESARTPQPKLPNGPAQQTFVCEVCRYGISIADDALPRCPMCGAEGLNEETVLSLIRCRLAELKRAGCDSPDCVVLAGRVDVDLEGAADLVARGCPADLALRILL
jgi:hypothetical protein